MATKRRPITFPELEARGRRSILRDPEEVQAEEALLEGHRAGMPANQQTSKPALTSATFTPSRSTYPKVTYRLSPDAVEAIDEAKRTLRRTYGTRVSLEEIAEAAIIAAVRDLEEN